MVHGNEACSEAGNVAGFRGRAMNGRELLRECRDCGLLQTVPPIVPDGTTAYCLRCNATLLRSRRSSAGISLACAGTAAALLVLAVQLPFMDIRVMGRFSRATVLTGPWILSQQESWELLIAVVLTIVLMPASRLAGILAVLIGARASRPSAWLPWLFTLVEQMSPWAMVDVFLLGVIVAYSRLAAWTRVDVGPSLVALAGVMMMLAILDATLDREAIWRALGRSVKGSPDRVDREWLGVGAGGRRRRWTGCFHCNLWQPLDPLSDRPGRCPRCSRKLHARKPNSVARTWALTLSAAALYIPANALPVMTVQRFGRGEPNTILSGVIELGRNRLVPLAVLVFVASVAVPVLKLVGLAFLLVTTRRRSGKGLKARARAFRFINAIGRWSMLDIFALTILVALVRFGFIATVVPGAGAIAFCAVVTLTMLATESFDPRLMWDAAKAASAGALAPPQRVAEPRDARAHSAWEPDPGSS